MKKLLLILLVLILFTRVFTYRMGGGTPEFPIMSVANDDIVNNTPEVIPLYSSTPMTISGTNWNVIRGALVTMGVVVGPHIKISWMADPSEWFAIQWSTNLLQWNDSNLRFQGPGFLRRNVEEPFKFWRLKKVTGDPLEP